MQKFDRRIRTCALGRGRERKGEACLLTLHLLELDIRTPARGSTRGARCIPGKNGGFPFIILKPRAEGYETEIVANFAFWGPINRFTCMRKPQALNALTVWVFASDETRARRLTAAKLHGTSPQGEQSSTEAVAEVQMDNRKGSWAEIATTKGNVTALWRQRNLRSGWRVRQYDLTTSLRQRWRRAISQLIGSDSVTQWAIPKRSTQRRVTYERELSATLDMHMSASVMTIHTKKQKRALRRLETITHQIKITFIVTSPQQILESVLQTVQKQFKHKTSKHIRDCLKTL